MLNAPSTVKRPRSPRVHVDVAGVAAVDVGLAGVHADRAADGVAPEQEALRSAQHLGAINVVHAGNRRSVAAFVELILENGRRRVAADAEVLCPHAADAHGVDETVLAVAGNAGCEGDQVLDVVQVNALGEVPRQCGDRQRDFLQRFFTLCRGNDDLFELLRLRGQACCKQCGRDRRGDCRAPWVKTGLLRGAALHKSPWMPPVERRRTRIGVATNLANIGLIP